jgi:hypothetical protein
MVAAATVAAPAAASATAASGGCRIGWGSQPKSGAGVAGAAVTSVRAARHACYDRVVFDGAGAVNVVQYVSQVTTDAQGAPVPLRGGAFLQVGLRVPSTTPGYQGPLPNVAGFRTVRQVAAAGGFEGYQSFGIGVRGRLPFRVFAVDQRGAHPRVVVDIAHQW